MKDILERAMDSRFTGLMLVTARVESADLEGALAAGFFSGAPGSGLHQDKQAAQCNIMPKPPGRQ